MRNFFEREFNPTQSSQEEKKKDDQAPDLDKRATLHKLLKIGAVAATAPFIEPFIKAKDAFSQIESGEFKEVKNGINWASLEAQEKLKDLERFFKILKLDEAKSPIVIGTGDDYWRGLSELARELEKAVGKASSRETAAFAFTGAYTIEKYPDLAKKLEVKSEYIYMIFNTNIFDPRHVARYGVHECLHAKHFADRIKEYPNDKNGYTRYPELPERVNAYFEEIITNTETLEFFQKQIGDLDKSILTDEEKKEIPQMIEREKSYFLDNYGRYYREKYPRDKFKNFEIPYGEFEAKDSIDRKVEELFRKYNIIDTLTREVESMK